MTFFKPSLPKPTPLKPMRILVLKGGWSAERDVSLESGFYAEKALKNLGHMVESFDPPRYLPDLVKGILQSFQKKSPELICNMLHGKDVEDGVIQGVFELMSIPYTSSGVMASALGMNKNIARDIASHNGLLVAKGEVLTCEDYAHQGWPYPHVLKPLGEGSSVGISYIGNQDDFHHALANWHFGPKLLVETYIPGKEIQVAVFGKKAMGAVEIRFDAPIFSYKEKYTKGFAQHVIPAEIPDDVMKTILHSAEKVHQLFECKGISRSDFRYNPNAPKGQQVFFLELNTQPGMTSISLVPDIARHYDWRYEDVMSFLIQEALNHDQNSSSPLLQASKNR